MNLIQQLQATPKWKEFENWYNTHIESFVWINVGQFVGFADITEENKTEIGYSDTYQINFCFLPIEFQKGVFEKFIESQGSQLEQNSDGNIMKYTIWTLENGYEYQESLEELLIWYFNN